LRERRVRRLQAVDKPEAMLGLQGAAEGGRQDRRGYAECQQVEGSSGLGKQTCRHVEYRFNQPRSRRGKRTRAYRTEKRAEHDRGPEDAPALNDAPTLEGFGEEPYGGPPQAQIEKTEVTQHRPRKREHAEALGAGPVDQDGNRHERQQNRQAGTQQVQ